MWIFFSFVFLLMCQFVMQRYCFLWLHSIKWHNYSVKRIKLWWTGNMTGWIRNVQVLLLACSIRGADNLHIGVVTGWIHDEFYYPCLQVFRLCFTCVDFFYNFSWFLLFFRNIFFNFVSKLDVCRAWKCQRSLICPQHTPSLFVGYHPTAKEVGRERGQHMKGVYLALCSWQVESSKFKNLSLEHCNGRCPGCDYIMPWTYL